MKAYRERGELGETLGKSKWYKESACREEVHMKYIGEQKVNGGSKS